MYARSTEPPEVRVYTADFRIYGMMHLPKGGGMATFLNKDRRPLVPMTGVLVYAPGHEHPPRVGKMRATPVSLRYKNARSSGSWLDAPTASKCRACP